MFVFSKRYFKEYICVLQAKGLCFVFFKEPYKVCVIFGQLILF